MTKKIFVLDEVPEGKEEALEEHLQKMYREKGVDVYTQSELGDEYATPIFLNKMEEIHLCIDDETNPQMVRMLVLAHVLGKVVKCFASDKNHEDTVGQEDHSDIQYLLRKKIWESKWPLRVSSFVSVIGLLHTFSFIVTEPIDGQWFVIGLLVFSIVIGVGPIILGMLSYS